MKKIYDICKNKLGRIYNEMRLALGGGTFNERYEREIKRSKEAFKGERIKCKSSNNLEGLM